MPACSGGAYQCAATQECHAADTGHDTPPRHSIQTQGRPVGVLSNDGVKSSLLFFHESSDRSCNAALSSWKVNSHWL